MKLKTTEVMPSTVRLPADWWETIEAVADEKQQTIQEWLREAIRSALPVGKARRLSRPNRRGRPQKAEA